MNSDELIRLGSSIFVISGVSLGVINIFGGSIYDFKQTLYKKRRDAQPHARHLRKRPQITVLVLASNDHRVDILDCLESIAKNNYRNCQILVTGKLSPNNHVKIKQFKQKYPKKSLKVSSGLSASSSIEELAKKSGGELVFVIADSFILTPGALRNAAQRFAVANSSERLVLIPDQKIVIHDSLLSLISRLWSLLAGQINKTLSVTGLNLSTSRCYIFKRQDMLKSQHKKPYKTAFASDISVYSTKNIFPSTPNYLPAIPAPASNQRLKIFATGKKLFKFYFYVVGLAQPIALSYFIYLAIQFHTPYLLSLSWAAVGVFLILTSGTNESLGIRERIRLILLAPVAFSIYYSVSFAFAFWQLGKLLAKLFSLRLSLPTRKIISLLTPRTT